LTRWLSSSSFLLRFLRFGDVTNSLHLRAIQGISTVNNCIVACTDVAIQRPWNVPIYQGRFWATARQTRLRSDRHERSNKRGVFSMWSLPRYYKQGTRLELSQFCTGVCEERTWARQAEESPLLEAVARERLVKTYQAGKGLVGAVVISGGTVIGTYQLCV
jgi:hypothetical protein